MQINIHIDAKQYRLSVVCHYTYNDTCDYNYKKMMHNVTCEIISDLGIIIMQGY